MLAVDKIFLSKFKPFHNYSLIYCSFPSTIDLMSLEWISFPFMFRKSEIFIFFIFMILLFLSWSYEQESILRASLEFFCTEYFEAREQTGFGLNPLCCDILNFESNHSNALRGLPCCSQSVWKSPYKQFSSSLVNCLKINYLYVLTPHLRILSSQMHRIWEDACHELVTYLTR